ncbi:MAG TPA: hypothetical protein VN930_01340 [Xanthobacteraceae bacterium]|nr:hypothetical protein [Xanthobacteraceae bacterium]
MREATPPAMEACAVIDLSASETGDRADRTADQKKAINSALWFMRDGQNGSAGGQLLRSVVMQLLRWAARAG